MIEIISLKNFKCFEKIDVTCRELNLFTGINGMGKSTLIQALLLLRQTYEKNNCLENQRLILNGSYVELGTQTDIMYWFRKDDVLSIEVEENDHKWMCQYDKVGNLISESQGPLSERDSFLTKKFEYISAERLGPRRYYDTIENENSLHSEIGVKGEKTTVCLYEKGSNVKVYPNMKHSSETSERLELQINAWLSEISPNIKVNVIPYLDVNLMGVRYSTSNSLGEESTNALNMGFGVSYSLPIIVALLSAREGDILVLENPEAHLHPRGQRKIGELVALAAANGVQIFMETHSDHVLNGIRLSVRNKKISSDKVKINYFYEYLSEEGIQKHEKTSPEILEDGSLSNWPEGFFDEWDKAIDELF